MVTALLRHVPLPWLLLLCVLWLMVSQDPSGVLFWTFLLLVAIFLTWGAKASNLFDLLPEANREACTQCLGGLFGLALVALLAILEGFGLTLAGSFEIQRPVVTALLLLGVAAVTLSLMAVTFATKRPLRVLGSKTLVAEFVTGLFFTFVGVVALVVAVMLLL